MRRFQKENSFAKVEKKIQVDNVVEFPSLSVVMPPLQSENKEKKNYVGMLIENNEEKKDVYLPGWLHMSMDKDRKVKKRMNGKFCEIPKYNSDKEEEDIKLLNKTEYNKKAVKVISEVIQNWENYKTWYISLYGVDCYDKIYEMVYKEDDLNYDHEYGEEDSNLNQDNIYTDEDDDDY
jgi:hypothetical protein